jgi:hypothetical protein
VEKAMLRPWEVVLYSFVIVLLPLAVFALVTGARPPENSLLSKYYRAEKHLHTCGNLFLLAVCANAIARLASHFGYVDAAMKEWLGVLIGAPFFVLLVACLTLWVRAYLRVRRTGGGATAV